MVGGEVFGTGLTVEAESSTFYEEARSILGSLVTRLLAIAHMIIDHIIRISRQILVYTAESPLAMTLLAANIIIWAS